MVELFKGILFVIRQVFTGVKTFEQELEDEFDKNPALYDEYLRLQEKAGNCREGNKYTMKIGDREISCKRLSSWEFNKLSRR